MKRLARAAFLAYASIVVAGVAASAQSPPADIVEVTRGAVSATFAAATNGDASAVIWIARSEGQLGTLRARGLVRGQVTTPENSPGAIDLADDVADDARLASQVIARPDGRFWVVYARQGAIFGRILSVDDRLAEPAVTLAVVNDYLESFRAGGRPDGGVFLWWHHQSATTNINHVTARAFDSSGKPVGRGSELLGGEDYSRFATGADGGALLVGLGEGSQEGSYFVYLYGLRYGAGGRLLSGQQLTPIAAPPGAYLEGFDVTAAAGGGYWLTWRETRHSHSRVWARRIDTGRLARFLPAGRGPLAAPSAATPDGGFLLCWAADGKLIAQAHGPDARPREAPVVLAEGLPPGTLGADALFLTGDGRGHYLVAWWGATGADRKRPLLAAMWTMP